MSLKQLYDRFNATLFKKKPPVLDVEALLNLQVTADGTTLKEVISGWRYREEEYSGEAPLTEEVAEMLLAGINGVCPPAPPPEPIEEYVPLDRFAFPPPPVDVFPESKFTDSVVEDYKDQVSRVNIGVPPQ